MCFDCSTFDQQDANKVKLLKEKRPYELLHDSLPSYDHLKVFGCLCFMTTPKQGRDKFRARANACVFMGYPSGQKGYKVMNLETHKFHISRDVIFHGVFPFATPHEYKPLFPFVTPSSDYTEEDIAADSEDKPTDGVAQSPILPPRRLTRTHKVQSYLQDYVCSSVNEQ